jgi:LysM repeat protein
LNVLASLPEADSGRPVAAVVTRGATLVQPVASDAPLLVEVAPTDAVVLAHLVLGGTQLSYAVWPQGMAPPEVPPVDERTARALLGLPPRTTPTSEPTVAPPATPTPVATPTAPTTPMPIPQGAADRYVVQPGDTLASIAEQLGIELSRLRAANPSVPDSEPLPAGMQLVVPQES